MAEKKPRTFKDKDGDEWLVEFTVSKVRRAKTELNVDIRNIDEELFRNLAMDAELIGSLIYLVCEPQIEARGLNDETFFDRFDGDTVEASGNALFEALIDFFPSQRRDALRMVKDRLDDLDGRLLSKAKTYLTTDFEKTLKTIEETFEEKLRGTPGLPSSPVSPS